MKKRQILPTRSIMLMSALLLGGMMASCSSSDSVDEDLPDVEQSTALFDYFTYKGEDDFYEENPLPSSEYFYNPILPGWYSDPSICTNGEGDYFLVTSTFSYFPGVPIFHSTDLVNWEQIGHVLDRTSQLVNLKGQTLGGGGIYAPAISYNPNNKTYYMVTTNVGAGNFFVKTQDPFDSWSDPIMLPDVGGIDPSFFFDDDGRAYIVNNDEAPDGNAEYDGHRTIRVREFDVATDATIGTEQILVNKGACPEDQPIWIEGPHLYKIDGKYYLMAAEGGTGSWHSEVIFQGDSPMGTFTAWENNPILTQRSLGDRSNPVTCAGHADLVQAKEGDWWAVFLACRPINNWFENLGRETFLMPVKWSDDGFPYMTQDDDLVPLTLKRDGVTCDDTVTFGNFELQDTFDDSTLDMTWMTLRGPATDLYSLTTTPGYLLLKCGDVDATETDTPALVCRRMQHHKFECTTRMLFEPSDSCETAGILLFKDETHQYFMGVNKNESGKCITLWQVGETKTYSLAEKNLSGSSSALYLKVVSTGTSYEFYYATQEGKWKTLCDDVDTYYLSTSKAGGFTGSLIGLYAIANKNNM